MSKSQTNYDRRHTKVLIKERNKRFQKTGDGIGQFGLFARKATEAVFVDAIRFNDRLNIDLVAKSGDRRHIAARAAAISATHLLVQKAGRHCQRGRSSLALPRGGDAATALYVG
jgi:hypothetical protein